MVSSERGQKVIERVLRSQVLVETDGPYVRIGGRPALSTDVDIVYRHLARNWAQPVTKVVDQVFNNFMAPSSAVTFKGIVDQDRHNYLYGDRSRI